MNPFRASLDAIDLAILEHLQNEGRISNLELARRVGLTPSPCMRLVQALEQYGVIKDYHAVLDREQLGYPILIFVMISLERQSEAKLKAFEKYVCALPEVHECYMLSGDVDFLLKVITPTTDAFRTFQAKKLKTVSNIARIRVAFSFQDSKRLPGVPIGLSVQSVGNQ